MSTREDLLISGIFSVDIFTMSKYMDFFLA